MNRSVVVLWLLATIREQAPHRARHTCTTHDARRTRRLPFAVRSAAAKTAARRRNSLITTQPNRIICVVRPENAHKIIYNGESVTHLFHMRSRCIFWRRFYMQTICKQWKFTRVQHRAAHTHTKIMSVFFVECLCFCLNAGYEMYRVSRKASERERLPFITI